MHSKYAASAPAGDETVGRMRTRLSFMAGAAASFERNHQAPSKIASGSNAETT